MKLALRELRRRPGRFVGAGLILFLLGSLLLLLNGLVEGLNANTDGIIRSQNAQLVVFSSTAQKSVPQSVISASTIAKIETAPGVRAAGRFGLTQLGARLPGAGPRDLIDVTVAGYDLAFSRLPPRVAAGHAWADSALRDRNVRIGTIIRVGPARTPLRVDGFIHNSGFQTQPTLWVSTDELIRLVAINKPGEVLPAGATQVVVVDTANPAATAAAIDRATGSTVTLTRTAAADAIPGIGGGVLQQIIGLTVVIAVAVVALFFALLTGERVSLYGVLKAIGARNRSIFATVVTQSVVLAVLAAALATAVAEVFAAVLPVGTIPFKLTAARLAISVVLLLVAAILGASFSLRRILRIDPASAIGTAS